jgi:dipeptidyl aminopeptidase/acylaminoacyl peptidase
VAEEDGPPVAAKRRMEPSDLYRFVNVSDPQISPDGELIAYVQTVVDPETKEPASSIWVARTAGGTPVPFTRGKKDRAPRWSPDGNWLCFVSARDGAPQLYLISRHGGEAQPLTELKYGAANPVWAPDSQRIAFEAEVDRKEERSALLRKATDADKKAEEKKAKDEARVFTKMAWRADSAGILPERESQIWVVNLPKPGATELPTPIQVTWGEFEHENPSWSPDGTQIAFVAKRDADEREWFSDIWLTSVPTVENEAAFQPVKLTNSKGSFHQAKFSPDGKTIALIGHFNEFANATQATVYLVPATGGELRKLDTADLALGNTVGADLRTGATGAAVTWAADGSAIYVPVSERGACVIYKIATDGSAPTLFLGGEREIQGATFDKAQQKLAFIAGDMYNPGDLYVYDVKKGEEFRLTGVNESLLAEIELPEIQELNFKARDGWDLHGWLVKPVGFKAGEKYPLILDIHGGPHTCFGHAFFQEFQLFAAEGYAVLFINPRGSTSYGQTFVNAVRGDYGNGDFNDLMDAVDYAISLGFVDEKRLGVTGGSYGGFMTNWIVGHTDRFAAAVSHRSISNWVSFSGTPDFGPTFNIKQHLVEDPWSPEGVQALLKISPITYVKNITTPIALFQSEFDFRCPIEQAEQFYMAIKFYGKAPTQLVRHPRSNHDLTRMGPPVLRVDRFEKQMAWFKQYCPPNAAQ